jgi:hypothetical protein
MLALAESLDMLARDELELAIEPSFEVQAARASAAQVASKVRDIFEKSSCCYGRLRAAAGLKFPLRHILLLQVSRFVEQ